jgi:hypothetical protein
VERFGGHEGCTDVKQSVYLITFFTYMAWVQPKHPGRRYTYAVHKLMRQQLQVGGGVEEG